MPSSRYLPKENIIAAGLFVNGPVWQSIKSCLIERRPPAADVADSPDVAAAKGHARNGFEKALSEIEELPFDFAPEVNNPLDRPSITETAD